MTWLPGFRCGFAGALLLNEDEAVIKVVDEPLKMPLALILCGNSVLGQGPHFCSGMHFDAF